MIFQQEELHHLEVYEVTPDDSGPYTVTARNPLGETTCSADLLLKELPVEEKPKLEAPKFIVSIETVESQVGETAKFYCKARGKPEPELVWFKDDKPVTADDSRYTISLGDDTDSTLVIVDLSPEDDGTFTCEAVNEAGKDRCKAELFIDEKPEEKSPPEFIKVPDKVTAREHDNAKFIVKVIGEPKPAVTWYKDEEPLEDAELYHTESYEDTHCFEIKDTEKTDEGPYTCMAENSEGKVTCQIPLFVNEIPRDERLSESPLVLKTPEETQAPQFVETFEDTTVMEQKPLQLIAKVIGLPRPEVTWFKDDRELVATPNTVVKHEEDTVKLRISPTRLDQEGVYKCVASNPAGSAECVAKVVVEGKTEPPKFTRPLSNRECKEGRPVKFECAVTGLPQPDISWFLNEQPVEAGVRFHVDQRKGFSDVTHSLSLDSTDVADSGTVKAVAVNRAGEASTDATLTVDEKKEAPKFIKKHETTEVVEFNNATFKVMVSGKPKPHVTWLMGDEELQASEDVIMQVEDQTYTLTINKVRPDQASVITARAKNPAGQVSCNARLKVTPAKKPTFVRKLSDALVPEHGTVKFDCKATGVPTPQIKWYINDKELEPSENITMDVSPKDGTYTLTIKAATPELAGEVKAIAV
ncbi:myopalladin, partial [Aplysia californica]|uniref:Myopalladin n=1 Tax=Aplysia californica TaxID=6500 RepID=A0ABM1ACX8_APLCA